MKKRQIAITAAIVAFVGFMFWLSLRHRIPSEHRWILDADQAALYEMDVEYDSDNLTNHGDYSKKPFLEGERLPSHNMWRAVTGPRRMEGDELREVQRALQRFDKESSANPHYDCSFKPRTCVVFQRDDNLLEVFVCVYCRYLVIVDSKDAIVASGFLHGSYKPFVEFVAKTLPDDDNVQEIKAKL